MSSTEPTVYFGRIDRNWPIETRDSLWQQRRFAVMYHNDGVAQREGIEEALAAKKRGESDWFRIAGYSTPKGVHVLKRLWKAVDQNALVFADFGNRSGEKPTILMGRAAGPVHIHEIHERAPDGSVKLRRFKCVELVDPKEYRTDPVLAAVRPRHGVFCRWRVGGRRAAALYEGEEPPRRVSSLTPGQLEALCYEYLRETFDDLRLFLPPGRTLPDLDIYAQSSYGDVVVAQVTHTRTSPKELEKKARAIRKIPGAEHRLVFAGRKTIRKVQERYENRDDRSHNDTATEFVPVEEVFEQMADRCPEFVSAMLNPPREALLSRDGTR